MLERLSRLMPGVEVAVRRLRFSTERRVAITWPTPPDWDEDEPPIREIDHTDDDPGPEELRGGELRTRQRG
jgi:hypothetical protein